MDNEGAKKDTLTLSTGETITICPIPFGKLPLFSGAVSELLQKLSAADVLSPGKRLDVKIIFDLAFEEIIGLMMLILDRPREWFDDIDIADGVAMLEIIKPLPWARPWPGWPEDCTPFSPALFHRTTSVSSPPSPSSPWSPWVGSGRSSASWSRPSF